MITINLIRRKADNLYYPVVNADKMLMQHCINEDLTALNNNGLHKAKYVAAAHSWKIEIKEEE